MKKYTLKEILGFIFSKYTLIIVGVPVILVTGMCLSIIAIIELVTMFTSNDVWIFLICISSLIMLGLLTFILLMTTKIGVWIRKWINTMME